MPVPPDAVTPEAARLREVIAASGVSTRDLAALAGLAPKHAWEIVAGKRDPRLSTVAKLLAACGRSWSDLDPKAAE